MPLREELAFIDDYMTSKWCASREKLRFFKEIDAETLDPLVPSMLLQPMIENSLKHGLAPRLEGGQIQLRTHRKTAGSTLKSKTTASAFRPSGSPRSMAGASA